MMEFAEEILNAPFCFSDIQRNPVYTDIKEARHSIRSIRVSVLSELPEKEGHMFYRHEDQSTLFNL